VSIKIRSKHSSVANKAPLPADLVEGEIALNINSASPAAYIKDSAGAIVKLAGVGSVSTPDATDAVKGVVELATATETVDGVDATRAVTPAGLKSALGAQAGSSTAPAAPVTGQVWVDSSTSPSTIKVWNGTAWIPQAGATVTSATAPTTPATGQIWIDNSVSPSVTKIWDGTAWVTANPDGSAAAALANDAKYATKAELPVLLYNRRPALHRGSLFSKTGANAISIAAGAVLNGRLYATATAVTMPGTHTNNADYAIWQHPTTGALVADASFVTPPAAAAGGSIVGGYHYIPAGRPTGFNGGAPTAAAEILEFSIWDLTWRPSCPDPRGMACIEGGFWIDLYLLGATSYASNSFSAVPSSRIGLTIADGSSPPLIPAQYGGNGTTAYADGKWYVFGEVARSFGKRLPTYDEFSAAAYGAPEQTSRGTDPGTVQWERISKFGLAQATGTLWVWGQETCTTTQPAAWTAGTETADRGQVYGPETRAVLLGGSWANSSYSGSRCAFWSDSPWYSVGSAGGRLSAGHLVLG
jgi:hypothetical protein